MICGSLEAWDVGAVSWNGDGRSLLKLKTCPPFLVDIFEIVTHPYGFPFNNGIGVKRSKYATSYVQMH